MKRECLKVFAWLFVVVFAMFSVLASSAMAVEEKPSGEPILVGLPVPVTGLMAADGAEMINGAVMAVEEINAKGGVLGRPLEAVPMDTKESQVHILRKVAGELADKGVDVNVTAYLMGPMDVHAFGRYPMPYLHADTQWTSTKAVMDNLPDYNNVFAIDPNEKSYGPNGFINMTKMIPHDHKNKTIAILTTSFIYAKNISRSLRDVVEENGWRIVSDTDHKLGTTEYGVELSEIRAANPDIIFFSTHLPAEAIAFMNQFLTQPTHSLIYIQYCPNIPEFREQLGPKANGVLWQTLIGYLPDKKGLAWVERYKKRFGNAPGYTAACNTYDAIHIWAAAVKAVGDSKNYAKVNDYILNNPYNGIAGTYRFNPKTQEAINGNVGKGIPNQFFQIQNGEQVLLVLGTEPTDAVFQTPPWFIK